MRTLFRSKGQINEERISLIETVVERLARRAKKRATGLITPVPISGAAFGDDVKGSVLRYMFPCDGTILKGMLRFGPKLKDGVAVTIHLTNDLGETSQGFIVDKRLFTIEPNIAISGGDCIDISIAPIDSEQRILEAWISFLWVPTVKDTVAKSYLIDELENDLLQQAN